MTPDPALQLADELIRLSNLWRDDEIGGDDLAQYVFLHHVGAELRRLVAVNEQLRAGEQ